MLVTNGYGDVRGGAINESGTLAAIPSVEEKIIRIYALNDQIPSQITYLGMVPSVVAIDGAFLGASRFIARLSETTAIAYIIPQNGEVSPSGISITILSVQNL